LLIFLAVTGGAKATAHNDAPVTNLLGVDCQRK
jgi:hypothetical protein